MAGALYQRTSDNLLAKTATTISISTGAAAVGQSIANVVSGNPAEGCLFAAATAFAVDIDLGASGAAAAKLLGIGNCNANPGISGFTLTGGASIGATTVNKTIVPPSTRPVDGFGSYFGLIDETLSTAYR